DGIRDGHVTGVQTCALPISSGIPLPTKLNRLFRLYSMQRNTPNADRMPKRDLAMAMTRPNLELVETARDRITIVAGFPHLSPAKIGRASCRERVTVPVDARC